nr:DUF637 domain-containing protein [Hydrogenophaga aromaticivorans]
MSAYQGAGGVSVQLPAGSNVRTAIETLSQKPGQGYLKELGNRSDIDWQRVEELNKSLDFSKSGLTQEATIVVIIVVSILTSGAASSAGGAAATAVGASSTGAVATAFTAGFSSLASTAAVSLINNKGDIGATLKELGSEDNAKGLLLTMATAGLTQGILGAIPLEGGGTLAGVNANSSVGQLLAKNAVQGISSAVLESAVMGTSLEDALKNNLQSALINTVAAQGADEIGDAQLDATSKALAHALLGCAMGAANAGSSQGCAPGATGAVIGEIVAGLYGDSQNLGDLEKQLKNDPSNAALKQQIAQIRNTVTELAKLTGAGGALLIGGDAETMQIAMGTAQNAAVNNFLNHAESSERLKLKKEQLACTDDTCRQVKQVEIDRLNQIDAWRDDQIEQACKSPASAACQGWTSAIQSAAASYQGQYGNSLDTAERSSVLNQAFKYQQAVNNPFLHGVGQGLLKLTPPGLAVGAMVGAAAAVQSVVGNGAVQTVVDAAKGLVELPENLRARLNSSDPSVVGEALVDVFALGSGATLTAAGGTRLVLNQVERVKLNTVLAQAEARARVENNFSRDGDSFYATTYGNLKDATAQARTQLGTDGVDSVTGKPLGNVATAEINVYGKPSETVQASSRVGNDATSAKDGFVSLPPEEKRIFKPVQDQKDPIPRQFDTEYKILENFAQKNVGNPQVPGNINLYTERAPCRSCTDVIERQFTERFPNMEVRLYHGNGEVTVYKGSQTQTFTVPGSNPMKWPTAPGGEVMPPRKP